MIAQLHTSLLLFVSLGLFLSLVAVLVVVLLVVSAMLRPSRWHERISATRLVKSPERREMLVST